MGIDPSAPSLGLIAGESGLADIWCLFVREIARICEAYHRDYSFQLQDHLLLERTVSEKLGELHQDELGVKVLLGTSMAD